jgi:ketosteroid isomerase-like protein
LKSFSVILIVLCCGVFLGYSNTFGQEDEIKKLVESVGDNINKAVLAGDYETLLSHFADDVIVDPIFQPPIKGKKAYREEIKKMKELGVKYQSMNGTPTDIWECGGMIYEMGTFGMSMVTRESPQPKAYYGSYFQIWQKQADGIYKIKYMTSNLDYYPFGN